MLAVIMIAVMALNGGLYLGSIAYSALKTNKSSQFMTFTRD